MSKACNVVVLGAVLCVAGVASAEQPYQLSWSAQTATPNYDYSSAVGVDGAGSAYLTGYTLGGFEGENAGSHDAFLAKYTSSGSALWVRQIGTSATDETHSVAVDGSGNVYITGGTKGNLGGTNAGNYDAFLAKYDSGGNWVWSRQIGTAGMDETYSVTADNAGSVYVAGRTTGSLAAPNGSGYAQGFFAKYSGDGTQQWCRQIETAGNTWAKSVAVDDSGSIYISGNTTTSVIGPFQGGPNDAYLMKYSSAGTMLWSRQVGTTGDDQSRSVAVDRSGNVYFSGLTSGSVAGPNLGLTDVFLIKYDGQGNALWSRQTGSAGGEDVYSVAVDALGNAYVSGTTTASLGGPSQGYTDVFVTKLDSSGTVLWAQQAGTGVQDACSSVAADGAGSIYVDLYTTGGFNGPGAGGSDAYLVKFSPVPEPSGLAFVAGAMAGVLRRRRR